MARTVLTLFLILLPALPAAVVELPSVPEPPDLEWVVSELALAGLGLLLEAKDALEEGLKA